MAIARCKVQCVERTERAGHYKDGEARLLGPATEKFPAGTCSRTFKFGGSYPQKGVPENEHFWEASPMLDFTLTVTNGAVDFEPGKHYYLDFVRVIDRPTD